MIGAAIFWDYRQAEQVRDDLQLAADMAALEGASLISAHTSSREMNARATFDRHYSDVREAPSVEWREAVADSGLITVTATADVPTTFLKLIGQKSREVSVVSSAPFVNDNPDRAI